MTAVMKGLARDVAKDNVTSQPAASGTDRLRAPGPDGQGGSRERAGITYEEARRRQAESIAAKRFGRPEELGAACAFLCSVHAGYISGQNLHVDGGSYPGLI